MCIMIVQSLTKKKKELLFLDESLLLLHCSIATENFQITQTKGKLIDASLGCIKPL